jgi:uncharacterized membrane protein YfcA
MPDISLTMVVVLCLAALAAGWIDAVVGGGGLLLLPVLLLGLPSSTPAAYALGTNKAVAIVGTSGAAVTYARKAPVDVRTAVRIGLAALAGSSAGAFFAAGMSTDVLKPVIMVVLLGVAAFVILRPAFGTAPATGPATRRQILAAIGLAGLGIGFYDGLVGPGTGTFLVLASTSTWSPPPPPPRSSTAAPTPAPSPPSPGRARSCGNWPPSWPSSTSPAAPWARTRP